MQIDGGPLQRGKRAVFPHDYSNAVRTCCLLLYGRSFDPVQPRWICCNKERGCHRSGTATTFRPQKLSGRTGPKTTGTELHAHSNRRKTKRASQGTGCASQGAAGEDQRSPRTHPAQLPPGTVPEPPCEADRLVGAPLQGLVRILIFFPFNLSTATQPATR